MQSSALSNHRSKVRLFLLFLPSLNFYFSTVTRISAFTLDDNISTCVTEDWSCKWEKKKIKRDAKKWRKPKNEIGMDLHLLPFRAMERPAFAVGYKDAGRCSCALFDARLKTFLPTSFFLFMSFCFFSAFSWILPYDRSYMGVIKGKSQSTANMVISSQRLTLMVYLAFYSEQIITNFEIQRGPIGICLS